MNITADAFTLFKTSLNDNKLYFQGEIEQSKAVLSLLDNSLFIDPNYCSIVNPYETILPTTIHYFYSIKDAIIFFQNKNIKYFQNSLIIITGNFYQYITNYISKQFLKTQPQKYKFIYHHQPNNFELIKYQINLLNTELYFNIKYKLENNAIDLEYKSNKKNLNFNQSLSFHKTFKLYSKRYYVNNLILKKNLIQTFLNI